MTFAREKLMANAVELAPLFEQHWRDVTPDFENVRLGFDWDTYGKLENLDSVHLIVAREADKIVGYQLCIVRPHLHSIDTLVATTAFFFMLPQYRKGWAGVNLFKATEESLKSTGIRNIYVGCKATKDLAPIFVHLGYHHVETMFSKVL